MNLGEAKQALATRLNINYSDISNNDLFSDSDLGSFVQIGATKAWDYKPWPFTQNPKTGTTIAATDYYDYPSDIMLGSISLLRVNGIEYKKLLFQDYLNWFQQYSTDVTPYWSEVSSYIYINKNAYTAGQTFDMFGKKICPQLVNSTDLLPFSPTADNEEYSGNRAIIDLAFGTALASEKKKDYETGEKIIEDGYRTLAILWKPFNDSRITLQGNNRPFFNTPDIFGIQPSSNAYNIGRFN